MVYSNFIIIGEWKTIFFNENSYWVSNHLNPSIIVLYFNHVNLVDK